MSERMLFSIDRLFNETSVIKRSIFIRIPEVVLCWFKSCLRLPDLHLVNINEPADPRESNKTHGVFLLHKLCQKCF